jgi:hypothetical protein
MQELGFNLKLELIDRIRGWGLLTQRHPTSAKIEFEHIGLYRKEK